MLSHPEITGSLYWSLPATVCLLLSAIAQPVRGVRVALVVVGTICLLLSMRRAAPRLTRALYTIKRMRWGRITLGRIVACRYAWKRAMKPFAKFMKEWDERDVYTDVNKGIGCLFGILAIFFFGPIAMGLVIFLLAVIATFFHIPGIQVQGDFSFATFMQLLGFAAIAVVMFLVWRFIIRIYLLVELEKMLNEGRRPEHQLDSVAVLERELDAIFLGPAPKPAKENPLPPENYEWELVCRVEYPGTTKPEEAESLARFCPRLNRSGVEPLLYHPAAPGHVDLLVGFPEDIMLTEGVWTLNSSTRPGFGLSVAAAVFVVAVGALAYEGFTLARG